MGPFVDAHHIVSDLGYEELRPRGLVQYPAIPLAMEFNKVDEAWLTEAQTAKIFTRLSCARVIPRPDHEIVAGLMKCRATHVTTVMFECAWLVVVIAAGDRKHRQFN